MIGFMLPMLNTAGDELIGRLPLRCSTVEPIGYSTSRVNSDVGEPVVALLM